MKSLNRLRTGRHFFMKISNDETFPRELDISRYKKSDTDFKLSLCKKLRWSVKKITKILCRLALLKM